MTVQSVVAGLIQMTQDLGTRSFASVMLANARMQSHQVVSWVQPKGPLRELADTLDHYVRNNDQEARALLQYAAGERNTSIHWMLGPNPVHGKQMERIAAKPGNAKALLRIIEAVDQAQPQLLTVKPGRFVRSIGEGGVLKWAEIDREFQFAERPVNYLQFLPLAQIIGFPSPPPRKKNVEARDPIVNVDQRFIDDWLKVLNFLSPVRYRLPKEKEWERGTAKNLRIVDLAAEARDRDRTADELIEEQWHRRYANAFLSDGKNPLNLGAAVFNEPERVLAYLRDGLAVSAWDFVTNAEGTQRWENVYEHVSIGSDRPDMARHIGYRYFANRDALRREKDPLQDPMNAAFRLAASGTSPAPAPKKRRS